MAKKNPSRGDRWQAAASDLREAVTAVDEAVAAAVEAASALADVQSEYSDWLDNMPDGLRDGPTGEKLQGVVDLDCDPGEDVEALRTLADEAEGVDLPLGWGRD